MAAGKRSATAEDAILGARPGAVYEPVTVVDAVEVVRESARDGKSLAFVGGGTDLGIGAPPSRLDAVLRTGRLNRLIDYAPSDQVVVVEAGITLSALQRALAEHGQQLALDPPLPELATVGGIIAANAFGPRRARYGSVRDLLIGCSFVRADGTLARGGGKVVKNVAGFDLPKLLTGSLGTLGLIVTANFRLHPLPEDSSTVLISPLDGKRVRELMVRIRDEQLEPTSLVALTTDGTRFEVGVRFEGFAAGVRDQRERLAALWRSQTGCEVLDAVSAEMFWDRHDSLRTGGTLRAKLAALPAAIEGIARDLLPPMLAMLQDPGFVWHATLGLGFISGVAGAPEPIAAQIGRARQALGRGGGSLTILAAPAQVRDRVDVWGNPPAAISLMRSVKGRLDPEGRFNAGRFVGGI